MTTVAIIGGGAAGMAAARYLTKHGAAVTLFESAATLGGNCSGVEVGLPDGDVVRVDAGVSDFNADTFVRFKATLDELDVPYVPIGQDASFMTMAGDASLVLRDGQVHDFAGSATLAAEIARFGAECVEVLASERFASWTLERYVRSRELGEDLVRRYLVPRAIGCFAMPSTDPRQFPIQSLIRFWNMHRLVGRGPRPRRMAVVGGMHAYVAAMDRWLARHGADVRCATRVVGVARGPRGVDVRANGPSGTRSTTRFDEVVFATPPGRTIALLDDPTPIERAVLSQLPSQPARLLVHTDSRLMPRDRDAWGAYNYLIANGCTPMAHPTITFFPKRLHRLPEHAPDVFVTLNPALEPSPDRVVAERFFEHPVATTDAHRRLAQVDRLQGLRNTWHCGSHLCEPFLHEQAYTTGEEAGWRLLGRAKEHPAAAIGPAGPVMVAS